MGIVKDNNNDDDNNEHEASNYPHHQQEPKIRAFKSFMVCLVTFVVSMTGGVVLGYWKYEYHATNSQLWMVPFGLILLVTPVMVWFALAVSEGCNNCGPGDHQVDIERTGSRSQR